MPTRTLTIADNGTPWVTPSTATNLVVECWGAGGGGGGNSSSAFGGGGGGGGAYSRMTVASPSGSYSFSVGQGGAGGIGSIDGSAGGDTWFISNDSSGCVARSGYGGGAGTSSGHGSGGGGGHADSSYGDISHWGGNGEAGRASSAGNGGFGGSSAGISLDGYLPHTDLSSWTTITYPIANTPAGGGHGGNGGGPNSSGSSPASGYGGGGGGSGDTNSSPVNGGDGADGKIILTWDVTTPSGTIGCSFSHSQSGTAAVGAIGTVALSLALAISAVAPESYPATADLSFEPSTSAEAHTTETIMGYRSLLGYWLGGSALEPSQAEAGMTFDVPAIDVAFKETFKGFLLESFAVSIAADSSASAIDQGYKSLFAYWMGGGVNPSSEAPDITGSGNCSFGISISAIGSRKGIRSPLAFWLGGAALKSGGIGGYASLTFRPAIQGYIGPGITGLCGGTQTIGWDANTEPDLAGYRIYYRTSQSDPYVLLDEVADDVTTYEIDFPPGVYYFVVTAFDAIDQESEPSNELEVDFGGLSFSHSTLASTTGQPVAYGTASLTFTPSIAAATAESDKAAIGISFKPSMSIGALHGIDSFTGTASLGFAVSVAAEAESQEINSTGTANVNNSLSMAAIGLMQPSGTAGLSFAPHVNATSFYGNYGTISESFTFSSASQARERNKGLASLSYGMSIDAAQESVFEGAAALSFEMSMRASNLSFNPAWAAKSNILIMEESGV